MKTVRPFKEISVADWDAVVREMAGGSVLMSGSWEKILSRVLPFVTYKHFWYRDTHCVRLAGIGKRITSAPFGEGGDVLALTDAPLDMARFPDDLHAHFGQDLRLRINERLSPLQNAYTMPFTAEEHMVSLEEPLLPRVRKTLRHIISQPIDGVIERATDERDIETAYHLYLRHMRKVRNFAMPEECFLSLIKELGAELWVWRERGRVRAIAVFLSSNDEVLYALSAADNKALAAHAPHHLLYTALEHYRKMGKRSASLGATGKNSPLEVFKRGWRGEEYRIFEIGARAGVTRDSRLRDLSGLVPLPLYPLLTKFLGKSFL